MRRGSVRESRADATRRGRQEQGRQEQGRETKDTPVTVKIDATASASASSRCRFRRATTSNMLPGKTGVLFLAEAPLVVRESDFENLKVDGPAIRPEQAQGREVPGRGERLRGVVRRREDALPEGRAVDDCRNRGAARRRRQAEAGEGPLKLDGMELRVEPVPQWKQMYHEAWRIQRDFFYDPRHHGLDLRSREEVRAVLAGLASRDDLNYLLEESLGEMTVGHMFVGGGERPQPKKFKGGLLGADYAIENGRYRFTRVYSGENWNPDLQAPLTQPGVNVEAGEYLLAVDGRELTATDDIYAFFEETAGRQVLLKVGPNPDGTGAREVTVVPVESEENLRHLAWIEGNRRKVDELTGGRVAYVYLPNTAGAGYSNFNRYYFAQVGKQAAIIDERFNGGGQLADYIVDQLRRPLLSKVARAKARTGRARRVDLRAEGDDHQRDGRLGRRRPAVVLPQAQDRAAGRQADLGRAGRHRRLSGADRRRHRDGAALGALRPRRASGRSRTTASRPTSRSISIRPRSGRATTRSSKRRSKWCCGC